MKNLSLLIICLAFMLSGCKKDQKDDADLSISYNAAFDTGTNTTLSVNKANLTFVETSYTSNFPERKIKTCTGVLVEADKQELRSLINQDEIEKLPEQSGCIGCVDGGAESISLMVDGRTYVRKFDSQNLPATVKNLIMKLRMISERFKDCK